MDEQDYIINNKKVRITRDDDGTTKCCTEKTCFEFMADPQAYNTLRDLLDGLQSSEDLESLSEPLSQLDTGAEPNISGSDYSTETTESFDEISKELENEQEA